MAEILPVHPVGWGGMKSHWWQFSRPQTDVVPSEVSLSLEQLALEDLKLAGIQSESHKPSSFGVYLGGFNNPPTQSQERLLEQWDTLIVDPFQHGVAEAIRCRKRIFALARLDLATLGSSEDGTVTRMGKIQDALNSKFSNTAFSGVLFANWEAVFTLSVEKKFFEAINSLGLAVYLETQPPGFLKFRKTLQSRAVSGLVIRNASISPEGEKRDYFQMTNVQSTIKACVSEACMRNFAVLVWETVTDDAVLSNAVVRRSLQWSNFYSAIPWIGTESALRNSDLNTQIIKPLPAFGWLKDAEIMKTHEVWRSNLGVLPPSGDQPGWTILQRLFPSIKGFLESTADEHIYPEDPKFHFPDPQDWVTHVRSQGNPLSVSATGQAYNYLGCFPLGSDPDKLAFSEILQSQQRLKGLGLLDPVPTEKVQEIGAYFCKFHASLVASNGDAQLIATVKELSDLASNDALRVNLALNSGLKKNTDTRFWAVHQIDNDGCEIFISKNAQGLAGIILHTFLSAKGLSRHACFEAETAFATWSHDLCPHTGLPRRLVQDIDDLSPEERIILLQHLSLTNSESRMMDSISSYIHTRLMDAPSLTQLKEVNTVRYLEQSVSDKDLVESRINWYRDQNCKHASLEASIDLFHQVDHIFTQILRTHREDDLASITKGFSELVRDGKIDAYVDMIALALFCVARKGAFDEIYTEVTDRNPLLNNQSDQAASFAESFALGSRCEAYFDVSPSVFGKLLSDRFRTYYNVHQPPDWINGAPELATTYAGAQIDVNPDEKAKPIRPYQRFTFLGVFAIPALIDIILLSIIGRGLYLSAYMTFEEQDSATIALMISLLLSGAIGTWISCGGPYYLISMAFAAANMFVLIRLIAGIAFTVAGGLIGFIAISAVKTPRAGIVFYLYFVALTIYFSVFACLASFSYPGSTFLSGRKAIILCIPILFISPIVTTFVGNDSAIYIAVLYFCIGVLLLCLRSTTSKWVTWYQSIRRIDDNEVRKWYIVNHGNNDEKVFANMSDPGALKLARETLLENVMLERSRSFLSSSTTDQLVKELVRDWESTNFLLDWYCRYADIPKPIPFSSSWNIQTKVALETLRSSQKGLRLHSAFIHWRQSSNDIGCGILYFVVALLDKWTQLLCRGHLLGLSGALTDVNRKAAGFALAYYLIGAILIDTKAQEIHETIGGQRPTAIKTDDDIHASQKRVVRFRRKIYGRTLLRFLLWHVWSLAISTALLWTFEVTVEGMGIFFTYVLSYTGLIWYQYTKIFAGPYALKPLILGICMGFPVAIALRVCLPDFIYSEIVGLGVATWSAALLSFWSARLGIPPKSTSLVKLGETFHAFTAPWADAQWSQQELQSLFDSILLLPEDDRFGLDPAAHPAIEIKRVLSSHSQDILIEEAFPNSKSIVDNVISGWDQGEIYVELVSRSSFRPGIRALSCNIGKQLMIFIGIDGLHDQRLDISTNCKVIAETLIHSVAEMTMGIPHEHAALAETIVFGGSTQTMAAQLSEQENPAAVEHWAKRELLKYLCLGFEPDIHWDKLPVEVRTALLSRCLGQPCSLTSSQQKALNESLSRFGADDIDVHIARCNLGVTTAISILEYAYPETGESSLPRDFKPPDHAQYLPRRLSSPVSLALAPFSFVYSKLGLISKFLVIALVADPEFQREFDHVTKPLPTIVRVPIVFILNMVWVYAKSMQDFGLSLFLFHGRMDVQRLWKKTTGVTIHIEKSRVTIENFDGMFTAFKHKNSDGILEVYQYSGDHKTEPLDPKALKYRSTYSDDMLLLSKQEFQDGNLLNEYHFDHRDPPKMGVKSGKLAVMRIPLGRRCVQGGNNLQTVQYNPEGLIESGSYMKDDAFVRFKYHYRKNPQFGDELLRAEFVMPHISCVVSWCAPPRRHAEKFDRWIPHSRVTETTFSQGTDVFHSRWMYDHKFHPTIITTVNGTEVKTPPMIEHDLFKILSKPQNTSFVHDDPFSCCENLNSNVITRFLGLTKKHYSVSTSRARSLMWKAWKDHDEFDGVVLRWMDDQLLRRDSVLAPYWRSRDWGNLSAAKKYLDRHADAVMAGADMNDNVSSWAPLAVKMSDLFSFGPGGDAVVTRRSKECSSDTDSILHVMAADTGTWPNEGGGVSACRRDMVNSLSTVRWHMLCESANDFGIPKHQTEQNVESLKIIPLWGLDFLTPTHGLFHNKLDSEVDVFSTASEFDLRMNFIPILTALVKGARSVNLSKADIYQCTRALVNLNTYFQESRHWSQVWNSELVKQTWRDLWLTQEMPNAIPSTEWFDTELPTLPSLDVALELWYRYLFIFSIPVPEKIPDVFQASHHSVSASYGVVCKIKRGCTLQIWDHAIAWRETNLCLSSALSKLSPFVRNALLGLIRITSVLTLHHADVILPCADFFNPGWEVEIGICQGKIEHRSKFHRKIDPVVNGITDMQKFTPVKKIKTERPTVTMLSHVWYAKDIKTALLAADIVINQWKFGDYHLDIYGAIDKAPTYSTECQEIIASKGLRGRVTLRGTADPMKVLEKTWLFLNSSLSEGLPLALGEAALTGAPVVCTDVGASLRVLSDPDDFSRFSAVVAPNDALALAKAQISMLALLGEWSQYSGDHESTPILTSSPTPEEVMKITRRMYEKTEQRRELGMKTRQIVQKSFSGARYLREHEQMLWVGKSATAMARYTTAIEYPATVEDQIVTTTPRLVHVAPQGNKNPTTSHSLSLGSSNSDTDIESLGHLQLFTPRHSSLSVKNTLGRNQATNPMRPQSFRSSLANQLQSQSHAGSMSSAGRDQLRGLRREDLMQFRSSDVSLIMSQDFLRSGMLWSG
ncbi:Glycosyl transferase family 1 [Penicillium longicatenatum]|uniref:Glycosyl transferase family 1 n=1 Tax=Penicillium longicatenatum TaxID=1561947 RepID=UPI00254699E0|nr:Glycosyl transferase family 1 [Penicillium longicatenatum]KAJ5639698.1 Glycosyl transferase family 1 [Penicillium longicatenatum]